MDGDMDEAKVETKVSSTALDVAPALAAPVPAPDPAGISTSDLFSKPPNSVESDDDIEIVELPEPGVSLARTLLDGDMDSGPEEDDNASDTEEQHDGEDEEPERDHATILAEVFSRPLVHYERTNPLVRDHGALGVPTKVSAPFNKVLLATPIRNRQAERDDDTLSEGLIIFAPPSAEQQPRTQFYMYLLLLLIPVDALLLCRILVDALDQDSEVYSGEWTAHYLWFTCSAFALLIGLATLKLKDTRFATLFSTVYLVDSLLNLIRVTTALQFVHFLFQLTIVYCMSQFKLALLPMWFPPVRI